MADIDKTIKGLEALYNAMHENQCYTCSYEFIEAAHEFGTEIVGDALRYLKDYKQHLQDDLEQLKEKKTELEFEINMNYKNYLPDVCGIKGKECGTCYCADGTCIAFMHEDLYMPATREQVQRRLDEGRYPFDREAMERYLFQLNKKEEKNK